MKSATGTAVVFFILIECRANFTDPIRMRFKNELKKRDFWALIG